MKDTRDLRDPQKLGEFLLRNKRPNRPLHFVADELTGAADEIIPNYPQDESMCMITQREYREELERRIEEGDRYAQSALASIDAGKGVIGFDDAGP